MQATFAQKGTESRGRQYDEAESRHRSCFQRDRDRIIHSSAFRRLKHKTQVFVEHEGDYFRTRLTHSIEVAQVARTLAVALGLNQELSEAVALAHDLGHPPFGHTGEDALNDLMQGHGGFDHNAQALRIVTHMERHYAQFDGLNLTWETLEGIAKHNGPVVGDVPPSLLEFNQRYDLELHTFASAEAQVAALSDDIAYNNHDLMDGLRAGLFTDDQAAELPQLGRAYREVDKKYVGLSGKRRRHEALRRVFGAMVEDVLHTSSQLLNRSNVASAQDVRNSDRSLVRFSPSMWTDLKEIRAFLFAEMYRAPRVVAQRTHAERVVRDLFAHFMKHPERMPEGWQGAATKDCENVARHVTDYIAGMTDRFALQVHAILPEMI